MADVAGLEQDVKLQRDSADLIADLKTSLKPFLWKTIPSRESKIRKRVKRRDLEKIIQLLDQFQELPQLLDPHLDNFVPLLADAFLAYLRSTPPKHPSSHIEQLVPLYKAICKILYTFCKVRGDKVIVRFFSTETRHLELLLSAIEAGTSVLNILSPSSKAEQDLAIEASWQWEETYITLLWLSQLLLAPFDLASISSESSQDIPTSLKGLELPDTIPSIAFRVISLAHRFLSAAGKERDAAKVLLVRVATRKDMEELGVTNALFSWTVAKFSPNQACPDTFESLGTLSFIAGLLTSLSGTKKMDYYLLTAYNVAQGVSDTETKHYKPIHTSPAARKIIIKIFRTVSVVLLQQPGRVSSEIEPIIGHMFDSLADQATSVRLAASKALSIIVSKLPTDMASQVVEEVLASFEKNVVFKVKSGDTESSRDLSRVNRFEWHGLTLTLSHLIFRRSIAPQGLPLILRSLRLALSFEQQSTSGSAVGSNVRDAACFGIWALARRYPTQQLESLKIEADVFSLFGVVSDEPQGSALQILATELVVAASLDPEGNIRRGCSAALQELIGRHPDTIEEGIKVVQIVDYHAVALRSRAVEEVAFEVARLSEHYHRGIFNGLLGWRGICDPSPATRRVAAQSIGKLSTIFNWVFSPNPLIAIYKVVQETIVPRIELLIPRDNEQRHGLILSFAAVLQNFNAGLTRARINDEFAAIPVCSPRIRYSAAKNQSSADPDSDARDGYLILTLSDEECEFYFTIRLLLNNIHKTLSAAQKILPYVRQPQLIADAVSHLIVASWWILRADCVCQEFDTRRARQIFEIATSADQDADPKLLTLKLELALIHERETLSLMDLLEQGPYSSWPNEINDSVFIDDTYLPDVQITTLSRELIDEFLQLGEADTVDIVSHAAVDLASLLERNLASAWVASWKTYALTARVPGRKEMGRAYLYALFKLPIYAEGFMPGRMPARMPDHFREEVIQAVNTRWNAPTAMADVELKVVILQCLKSSLILRQRPSAFISILNSALDDYTTNARGDIGSLVRVEAAKAVAVIWDSRNFTEVVPCPPGDNVSMILFPRIMRIASEKLDRVRSEGRKALSKLDLVEVIAQPKPFRSMPDGVKIPSSFYDPSLSDSSKEYFRYLLEFRTELWRAGQKCVVQSWGPEFMAGYVTSADTGSEDLVRSSRAALVEFCTLSTAHAMCIAETISLTLSRNMKNDRVLVPALEVVAFLLDMNLIPADVDKYALSRQIYISVDEASHRTKNVRRIEAVIKCLGGLFEIWDNGHNDVFGTSPMKLLAKFLLHKFPKIRNFAADEIFIRTGKGKGIEWEQAGNAEVDKLGLRLV